MEMAMSAKIKAAKNLAMAIIAETRPPDLAKLNQNQITKGYLRR